VPGAILAVGVVADWRDGVAAAGEDPTTDGMIDGCGIVMVGDTVTKGSDACRLAVAVCETPTSLRPGGVGSGSSEPAEAIQVETTITTTIGAPIQAARR
jgi:hypothetical protein